jgi:hypothetical protein
MRAPWVAASLVVCAASAGCVPAGLEGARLASPAPEIASCGQWFRALDAEIRAAGVRDEHYRPVSGFPYLRADRFLAESRARAAASPAAFDALSERLLENDLESRRFEIDNLPAANVEKWSGMRSRDSRELALERSAQCGRLLRAAELSHAGWRQALLEGLAPAAAAPRRRCAPPGPERPGALVRFSPPIGALSRAAVAGGLLRAELDPLGQPLVAPREFPPLAAAYAPVIQVRVASDDDRLGALRWRRGADRAEVDATEPAVYTRPGYARYEDRGLLQVIYLVRFAENSIALRVTLAPDGEPILYEASGADGCYALAATPRARARERAEAPRELPRLAEDERPLVAIAAATHELEFRGVVPATESLARYALRPYAELRSAPTLDGRNRAAATRPKLEDADRFTERFALDLAELRP